MTETATYRELRRSRSDRMLGGVCGGLGEYFDLNPTFYRVGFVLLSLLGGAGILIYGACVLVIPNEGEQESIASEALRNHRRRPAALVGLMLVAAASIALLSHVSFRIDNDVFWLLALVVGAALLWSQRAERAPATAAEPAPTIDEGSPPAGEPAPSAPPPPPPPARGPSLVLLAFGGLIVAGGVLGLLELAGVGVPWAIALSAAAIAVGVGVVAGAVNRQRVGWLAVLGIVLAIAAIAASVVDVRLDDGIGQRTYRPATAADLRSEYRLGIGGLELDLTDLELPPGQTHVDVDVGLGHVEVILPPEGSVHVLAHADWGEINLPGEIGADGQDVSSEVGDSSAQLVLDTEITAGRIDVRPAVP